MISSHLFRLLHRFGFLTLIIVLAGTLCSCGLKRNLKLPPAESKSTTQSPAATQTPTTPTTTTQAPPAAVPAASSGTSPTTLPQGTLP